MAILEHDPTALLLARLNQLLRLSALSLAQAD